MFRKVFTNTLFQIIGKAVTASTTFLLTIIIGRSLGPAGFGEFTKIFVYVGYFYIIYDFGLNNIFVKISSGKDSGKFLDQKLRSQEFEKHLFRLLLGLRIFLSIVLATASIVIVLALPYNQSLSTGFNPLVKIGIVLASVTIVTQALLATANALFQRRLRYDLSVLASASGSLGVVISAAFVLLIGGNLLGYVAAYIAGGLICAFVALWLILKKLKVSLNPIFNKAQAQRLLSQSWPIGLALILNLVYFRIDVLILSYHRQSAEVGFYGLSYQFFEAFLTVPIFISNALYPLLARLFASNRQKFAKEARFYFALMIAASLAFALVLFIISFLIPTLYGIKFAPAKASMQILALGLPFFFASALLWHILIIDNRKAMLPLVYGLGALFNVAANLVFIPIYGYLAAASITVTAEGLVTLLLIITLKIPQYPKSG